MENPKTINVLSYDFFLESSSFGGEPLTIACSIIDENDHEIPADKFVVTNELKKDQDIHREKILSHDVKMKSLVIKVTSLKDFGEVKEKGYSTIIFLKNISLRFTERQKYDVVFKIEDGQFSHEIAGSGLKEEGTKLITPTESACTVGEITKQYKIVGWKTEVAETVSSDVTYVAEWVEKAVLGKQLTFGYNYWETLADSGWIYVTDSQNWIEEHDKKIYCYAWTDGTDKKNANWPGVPMEPIFTNSGGQMVYGYDLKGGEGEVTFTHIIFNNGQGGSQTKNISIADKESISAFWITGPDKNDQWKHDVEKWKYDRKELTSVTTRFACQNAADLTASFAWSKIGISLTNANGKESVLEYTREELLTAQKKAIYANVNTSSSDRLKAKITSKVFVTDEQGNRYDCSTARTLSASDIAREYLESYSDNEAVKSNLDILQWIRDGKGVAQA